MSDATPSTPSRATSRPTAPAVDLGIYARAVSDDGLDPVDRLALVASGIWVMLSIMFLAIVGLGAGEGLGPLRFLIALLAIGLPIALAWIAAIAIKGARVMREESERLKASMDAMRQIYVTQAQMAATTMGPNVERKIDEIVKGQQRAESALAHFTSQRVEIAPPSERRPVQAALPQPQVSEQPGLALGTPNEAYGTPVSTADFISALNFPETADDAVGFAALKRALADRRAASLITASQDILTLLSQDGIYMDDLAPDRARPEIWRRFAGGERGREISGLGGVHDRSSLALSAARMREDPLFRDAAHHFLRTFDKTFVAIAENLSDTEIIAVSDTRTARAFMLLGRVAGMFG